MPQYSVLDSSVILAQIQEEPGHEAFSALGVAALVSTVNLAEVRTRLCERGMSRQQIAVALSHINMRSVAFDDEQAMLSAELRPPTRALGLSLGDRACIALALLKDAEIYTADRVWSKIDLPVSINVIR